MNKGATPASTNKTKDEKSNARFESVVGFLLRSYSITLTDASIVISGAGSKLMKELRKQHGPRESNILLAKLPKLQRALTIIGTDSITISCSPDVHCNLLICLVGVHIKVGNPVPTDKPDYVSEIRYAWQTVTHPFDIFLEVKGLMPILVWALQYDHEWTSRKLELNLTTSEIAIYLSPEHVQTLILHLDDYADAMSPYNEWYTWLYSTQQEMYKMQQEALDKNERSKYCHNFAIQKGTKMNDDFNGGGAGCSDRLTPLQMTQFEKQLTRFEIILLRCIAMGNGEKDLFVLAIASLTPSSYMNFVQEWKITTENDDFAKFLLDSQSVICRKADDGRATSLDVLCPFQRLHQTPQHALAVLVMNKYSSLSPGISISFCAKALRYEFPHDCSMKSTVPSSLCLSDFSLILRYSTPLLFHTIANENYKMHRQIIDLSIHTHGIEWSVIGKKKANERHPPAFANNSLVGIISKASTVRQYDRDLFHPAVSSQ